jgi:hypothetical protein
LASDPRPTTSHNKATRSTDFFGGPFLVTVPRGTWCACVYSASCHVRQLPGSLGSSLQISAHCTQYVYCQHITRIHLTPHHQPPATIPRSLPPPAYYPDPITSLG